jgi:hypothetical protein
MKEQYLVNTTIKDDFNLVGMYFLEHNFLKYKHVDDEELLQYISSIIEAVTIRKCIDDVNGKNTKYLKIKNQEILWLAAKSRFRAKSNIVP